MISEADRQFMRLALREARKGLGRTSPNPCVGAVVVRNDRIVGKGYHRRAGTPHAEVHALAAAGAASQGATLYVTLEPCSHTGRTPPCCEAVAAAGISRVVIGMEDPNPLVQGRGMRYLQDRGIAVVSGVLEDRCREINRPFIKHISTGLPWVVMKAGMSLDARITYSGRTTGWMTGKATSIAVHRLRDRYDAILVGRGTVMTDDPALTTRLPGGRGRDPVRIVLDSRLQTPEEARILNQVSPARTLIFCSKDVDRDCVSKLSRRGAEILRVEPGEAGGLDLRQVLLELGRQGISSVMVEGGSLLHGSMLRQRLYDYAHLFYAPVFAGDGGLPFLSGYTCADQHSAFRLQDPVYRRYGKDMLISGFLDYR
jgi:diaminohydroxyphosphoribosylaminopyrimidine deaminase/5-amino-6-(5-phosphoribosylamino)uracil reductase